MKLRIISEITATLPFTEFDFMQKYRDSFAVCELGRIYAQLPLKELAETIRSHFPKTHPQGNSPMFPPEEEVALIFLKSYTGLSDEGLIEMLNGSIHLPYMSILVSTMTSADSSQFIVTARPLRLRTYSFILYLPDLPWMISDSYWTLSSLADLSSSQSLYRISVRQTRCLSPCQVSLFLLRTSAIQASLIAFGLASVPSDSTSR